MQRFCPILWVVFLCLFWFLGPHLWHMEVPGLGVELELRLLAYTTAHSSWQCRILNLLSEARDQICLLMDASQIR